MYANRHRVSVYGIDYPEYLPINHRADFEQLAAAIKSRFGRRVDVVFINTLGKELIDLNYLWPQVSVAKLPLVMLDDQPLQHGEINTREVVAALGNLIGSRRRPFPF